MERRAYYRKKGLPWLLIGPQLLLVLVFFYWPTSQALYWAFTLEQPWGGGNSFVGWDNLAQIFHDAEYWTTGKWFGMLVLLLVIWTGIYLVAHSGNGIYGAGYEYATLSNQQVRQVNRILADDNPLQVIVPNSATRVTPGTLIDSASSFSAGPNEINFNTAPGCDRPCRADKVLLFLNHEFDNKISPEQAQAIRQYIGTFNNQDVGVFLADYKIKLRSYFWLAGPLIYAESIFWVIAGVICSLMFAVGAAMSSRGKRIFNGKQVISQLARMFYAPFLTIVILLAYNYFSNNTTLSSNLGQGIIIFAFIMGLFSGRVMNFFDRLKQLILPSEENAVMAIPVAGSTVNIPVANTTQPRTENENTTASHPVESFAIDENGELNALIKQKKADGELVDVEVELKLDGSGLFDDERNDINNRGFANAIVTLHNVNGKDIIAAKKHANGKESFFFASNVKPGIYIARATLSQKMADDHIINLFGERTSYMTVVTPGLELYIRKYELAV